MKCHILWHLELFTHQLHFDVRLTVASFTHKGPPIVCSRRQFQILPLFKNNKRGMIFHDHCLLADNSHVLSYLMFSSPEPKAHG